MSWAIPPAGVRLEEERLGLGGHGSQAQSAAGRGSDHQLAHQFGTVEGDLLPHQTTHGVGENVDDGKAEGINERLGVPRHLLDGVGSPAAAGGDAGGPARPASPIGVDQ